MFNSSSVRQSSESVGWSLTSVASSSLSTGSDISSSSSGPAIVTPSSSSLSGLSSTSQWSSSSSSASYYSSSSNELLSSSEVFSSSPSGSTSDQTSTSISEAPFASSTASSSSFPRSSSVFTDESTDGSTVSSTASPSPAVSPEPSYIISSSSKSEYIIYTQHYRITGSSTTFETGLPTTTVRAKTATSSFSVPTATQTRDLQFYQNWLSGSLDDSSSSTSPTRNKIIGGVVGGVGGLLICTIIVWFMFFRRRRSKAPSATGFTYEIGRRAGYPSQSQSIDLDQEKVLPAVQGSFLSRMKNKAIARLSRGRETLEQPEDRDPFQDEFNFRERPQPAALPPRRQPEPTTRAAYDVPIDHRFSYVSSMTDSSYISSAQGDYSSLSSTSLRLPPDVANRSEGSHGFLREVI